MVHSLSETISDTIRAWKLAKYSFKKWYMALYTCNPRVGGKRLSVPCQLQIHGEFESSGLHETVFQKKKSQNQPNNNKTHFDVNAILSFFFSIPPICVGHQFFLFISLFSFLPLYLAPEASALCMDHKPVNDILRLLYSSKCSNAHSVRSIVFKVFSFLIPTHHFY